jgi:hypothetical protein
LPRTVIIPKCFAENSTCVWYGSSCQFPMGISLPRITEPPAHTS